MSEQPYWGGPILAFDTDELLPAERRQFVRGAEIGALEADLRHEPGRLRRMVHSSNSEMVLRLAEAIGRSVVSRECGPTGLHDEVWLEVEFSEAA